MAQSDSTHGVTRQGAAAGQPVTTTEEPLQRPTSLPSDSNDACGETSTQVPERRASLQSL